MIATITPVAAGVVGGLVGGVLGNELWKWRHRRRQR